MKKSPLLLLIFLFVLLQNCSKDDGTVDEVPDATFHIPNTEDIVMYEINPGAFSVAGNLQGITDRLDNIKSLGVNTIWIMPIYPVGITNSFGSPYCVKDYRAVNAELGSMNDLRKLVTEAHKRNIAVLLDWVANHTSWDNSWITAHPDWYTDNGSGAIVSPAGTNWNDVADLNFENNAMRLEMISAMKYWVTEAGIDGFRCDAADFVPFDFWQQANTALNAIPNRDLILLAEGSRADHFTAGFQMNFAWNWLDSLKNVFNNNNSSSALNTTNTNEYTSVPPGKRKLRFTTNHDISNEATPLTVFGGKNAAIAASVITIYFDGVALLYCGQEVGVPNPSIYTSGNIVWNTNSDILTAYTKLLTFYNNSAASRRGVLTTFSNADIVVFEKILGNEKVLVIVNTRSSSKTLAVPASLQQQWTNALTSDVLQLENQLSLNAYGYLIFRN